MVSFEVILRVNEYNFKKKKKKDCLKKFNTFPSLTKIRFLYNHFWFVTVDLFLLKVEIRNLVPLNT